MIKRCMEEKVIPPFNAMFQHSFSSTDGASISEQENSYNTLFPNIEKLDGGFLFVVEADTPAHGRHFVGKILQQFIDQDKLNTDIRWINLGSCGWEVLNERPSNGIVVINEVNGSRIEMTSSLNELHCRATRILIVKPGKYRAYELICDNIDKPDMIWSIKERKIVSRTKR